MNPNQIVEYILKGANSPHVVVGPVTWQPSDGLTSKQLYFIVATSEKRRGFRCDRIDILDRTDRDEFFVALVSTGKPLVVHDMGCELTSARLCESLWPGKRITALRKKVEAEFAAHGS